MITLFNAKYINDIHSINTNQDPTKYSFNIHYKDNNNKLIVLPFTPIIQQSPQKGDQHGGSCSCSVCNEHYRMKYLKYKQKYLAAKAAISH